MILQIGTIVGYNNTIVIATENQTLGFNSDVNIKPVAPTTQPATIQGTPTKKSLPEPQIYYTEISNLFKPKPKSIIPEPHYTKNPSLPEFSNKGSTGTSNYK